MDPVIQSQIQSPLVRTLQSIPTNSSNYVHGIPDNTPPFSKHKVKVLQHIGNDSDLTGVSVFKIPQNGHLCRMALEMRVIGHGDNTGNHKVIWADTDNPCSIADSIEYIQLRTHNDVIETLYASSIPFINSSLATSEVGVSNMLSSTAGYIGANSGETIYYEPKAFSLPCANSQIPGDNRRQKVKDYYFNLPFSTLLYFKDALQTRLMEDLEIVVKKRLSPTQFSGNGYGTPQANPIVDRTELSLHCNFVNFHENVEEVIRNENFKPNIPAELLSNDQNLYKARFVPGSKIEAPTGNSAEYTYSVNLTTDALVNDLFIVPKVHPSGYQYERVEGFLQYNFEYTLTVQGVEIFRGTKFEFDSVEALNYSTVTRQYQSEGVFPPRWSRCGTHIRFGLNNTDEYFDGGFSLQSAINPVLTIKVYGPKSNIDGFRVDVSNAAALAYITQSPELIEFDVILKRKVMLRIDGNTGKIAKSLES